MSEKVVVELLIDSRGAVQGSAEAATAMRAVEAGAKGLQNTYDRTIEKVRALNQAQRDGAMVMVGGSSSITKLVRDYEKLLSSIDPTTAAISKARGEMERTRTVASRALTDLGRPFEEVKAVIDQAIVRYGQLATAARESADKQVQAAKDVIAANAQAALNDRFGIGSSTKSAEASADAFLGSVGGLKGVAESRAREIALSFGEELNNRLIAGSAVSAKSVAAIFENGFDPLDDIAKGKAQQAGRAFSQGLNESFDFGKINKGAAESAQAFQRLQSVLDEIDPSAANTNRMAERMELYNELLDKGYLNQEQFNKAQAYAQRQFDLTQRSIDGSNQKIGKFTTGMGLARHETINLSRQIQDVGVSLASGQSFFTVLIQQGTQIFDVFSSSQATLGGFVTQAATWFLRFSPIIVGATTALAAFYATFKVGDERQALSNSLLGGGRASGMGASELEELARTSARSADITVSNARLIAAEFVKLGQVARTNIPQLEKTTKDFAAITGQSLQDAAKTLAGAFADPVRGAEQLSEKLGALDSTTLRMIRTATDLNDKLRAQKLLMDEVGRAAAGAADVASTKWEQLASRVGKTWGAVKEAVASPFVDPTENEKIDKLKRDLTALENLRDRRQTNGNAARPTPGLDASIENTRREIKLLEDQKVAKEQIRQVDAKRIDDNQKIADGSRIAESINSGGLAARMKLYDQEQGKLRALEAAEESLKRKRNDMGVPDVSNRAQFRVLTDQIKEASDAVEAQRNKMKDLTTAYAEGGVEQAKAARSRELDLKASRDKTLADAQETAAMRARNDMLGEARTQAQEDRAARQARNKVATDGAITLNQESQAIRDNTEATNAGAEAARRGGKAAAEAAEDRKRAQQQAERTGGNAAGIVADQDAQKLAELKKQLAEYVFQKKQETEATRQANSAAQSGNQSATVRAQLEERIRLTKEKIAEGEARLGKGSKEAVAMANEQADALERQQKARNETAGIDYFNQQGQTLETIRKQNQLVFETIGKRQEELEVLRAQQQVLEMGLDVNKGIGKAIVDRAREIGRENQLYEDQLRIRQQIRQAQDFAADSAKSFLNDLLTGTEGLSGALKNLGRGYLSASLDALISGKGPLAGLTGMSSATKDGQGGILGMLTTGIQNIGKEVQKGSEKGSAAGIAGGIANASSGGGSGWLTSGLGIDGKQLAGGLSAIAGLAGAYGAGMSAGSTGQAIGGGAISGAMAGLSLAGAGLGSAAVLGPIGLIAGAALGYFGNQAAKKQQREERQKQAEENYNNAKPQIAALRSQLRGEPQDTLQKRIADTEAATMKLAEAAFFASKTQEAHDLYSDFMLYKTRSMDDFRRAFGGLVDSLEEGMGPNSAFSAARDAVKQTGDVLKGFVADAKYVFGDGAAEVEMARQAAIAHAKTIMEGTKTLSMVETRMEEIRGAGAALQQVFVDLGMSAKDAAEAVRTGTVAALDRLRDAFNTDLIAKVNAVEGVGYIDDLQNLLKEVAQQRKDAAAIGGRTDLPDRYLIGKAQEIVNSEQIAGQAFDNLIAAIPELAGIIREFTGELTGAARDADIAARRLAYLDRLFAATNDSSTLEGQLAAYDRTAIRQREEEYKKGGEAMLELEMAQQAERYNIIRDWNQKVLDDQKRAAEEAKNFLERFTRSIREFIDGLRAGAESPLSPQARLAAAQQQYAAQLALAQGGNRDALNGITGYANDLIEAAKAYYASSTGFQNIFEQVIAQLEALPSQISAEQLIVNAIQAGAQTTVTAIDAMKISLQAAVDSGSAQQIAMALSTYFNKIDTNTSQTIDFAEMQAALGGMASNSQLRDMFTRLDTDNSGSISRLEAIKGSTDSTNSNLSFQNQILDYIKASTASTNVNAASIANAAEVQKALLNSISGFSATQNSLLTGINTLTYSNERWLDRIRANIGEQNRTRIIPQTGYLSPIAEYAQGGFVMGPGSGTSDSISARLSAGEFIMRKSAVDYFGRSMLGAMNDNLSLPMPAPANANGGGVLAELQRLNAQVERLRVENNRGHEQNVDATEQNTDIVSTEVAGVRAVRVADATNARQAERRPRVAGTRR